MAIASRSMLTSFIPRGLIGNTGKVLGARALVLLHDEQGHPLLATTHRGDHHLTVGVPAILARYEASGAVVERSQLIVDREGMGACFLRDLTLAGYTVVTVLKTDQVLCRDRLVSRGMSIRAAHL